MIPTTPHLPPLRARAWPGGPLIVGSAAYVVAVVEAEREAATVDVGEVLRARMPVAEVLEALEDGS